MTTSALEQLHPVFQRRRATDADGPSRGAVAALVEAAKRRWLAWEQGCSPGRHIAWRSPKGFGEDRPKFPFRRSFGSARPPADSAPRVPARSLPSTRRHRRLRERPRHSSDSYLVSGKVRSPNTSCANMGFGGQNRVTRHRAAACRGRHEPASLRGEIAVPVSALHNEL